MTTKERLPPVRKSVHVPWPVEAAFVRFTREMGSWWPLRTHSVGADLARGVVFEEGAGGRIYEREEGGQTHLWGTVTAWEPPRRVRFTWHPGREASGAQDVEVRFTAEGGGTRVELTHSGWETLGDKAASTRRDYDSGWPPVLARYAGGGVVVETGTAQGGGE